ncbi:InlB B-repeat-containing protein [Paenibacillus sp. FSL H8-0537]|uniref:InlB B-repeat-containing protein n=1 Tax=Paenibacillus sp. FSL H8-0537 TaxID=2921399 RepID=UPI003101627E
MNKRWISLLMVLIILLGMVPTFATAASTDNWVNRKPNNLVTSNQDVCYGNGKFMAVTDEGGILTSSDGTSWTYYEPENTLKLSSISCDNGQFVAVTRAGLASSSSDGVIWKTGHTLNNYLSLWGVSYGNGLYVAVGNKIAGNIGAIYTSTTSETPDLWTDRNVSTTSVLKGVTYGNQKFVAVGQNGTILTSSDGVSWTSQNSGTAADLKGVKYLNGKFVSWAVDGTTILTSVDGVSWSKITTSGLICEKCALVNSGVLHSVSYGNGTYVGVGSFNSIYTSSDLVSWTKSYEAAFGSLNGVTYGNGTFIVVGNRGDIFQNIDLPTYTVTYNGNGSTGGTVPTDSNPYEQHATVTVRGNTGSLVKTGHTFAGWNTASNGTGTAYAANATFGMGAANVTLYAQWTANPTYTVTYNGNGSTGGTVPTDSNPYEQHATVTVRGNTGSLVKTGHTFAGWNTASNGTGTAYAANATFGMGSANVTLYAQWTVNPTYTVTYNGNGSTGGTVPTDSNPYEQHATVTVRGNTGSLVKTGHTFAGWNTASNGTGTAYAANATFGMGSANVTLYAQWTVNPTYTVTYNGNGSTGGTVPTDSNPYEQHATVTVRGNTGSLVKTGHTFAGWNTASNGTGTAYAANATFGMGSANVTLYAQWTVNPTYTVTYNGNGSTGGTVPTDSNPYEQHATVTVRGNTGSLVKTGHTFAGWNTASNGTGTAYAANATFGMGAANVTLYAQWTVNPTYTVTYNGNGSTGGTVPTDSNPYEQHATVTVRGNTGSLVKTGHTFAGWNTASNGTGTAYAANATFGMGAANVTLYAQWTVNPTYTVTYNGNGSTGGTVPTDSNSYEQHATVTVLGNTGSLVKTGHTFTGWNTAADGTGTPYAANATFGMGAANVTLYAQWTANPTYTVTYNGNGSTGGSVPTDSNPYAQNATVTVLGNTGSLVKTGHTFTGWNTAANGSGTSYVTGATFTMAAANVTLYAQWTASPGGGSGGSPTPPDDSKVISVNGDLSLPAGKTGKVSLGDAITIDIPANATDKELKLTIEKLTGTQDLLTDEDVLASPIFEILKNFSENFSKPVTLTFKFDPTKLSGNQRAAVFYYDEVQKKWVEVGGVVRGNQITAEVTHFTKFAVMVVGQAASEPKPTINFSDISAHWAKASIKQAVSSGIVTGYQDGTFKPDKTVTRAEFAVMLMNALKTQGAGAVLTFTDTAKIGSWAQKAVAQAVQAGIINGYEDGTFRPTGEITRAEMAAMIAGALGKYSEANATATSFADDKDIPAWAKAAVAYVKQASIVQGKGDNQFAPGDHATRAEAVTVLLNMLAQMSK